MKSATNSSWLKTIAYGTSISMLGQFSSLFLAAVLQFMIARGLGATVSGSIALGLSLMTFLANLSLIGLDKGIVRFFPAYNSEPRKQIHLLLVSGLITLSIGLLFFFLFWWRPDLITDLFPRQTQFSQALPYFLLLIPANALIAYLTAVTQTLKKFDYQAFFIQFLLPSLKIVTLVWVVYAMRADVKTVVLGFVAATVLVVIWLCAALWKTSQPLQPGVIARVALRPLLIFSAPLFLITIIDYGWSEAQILILGSLVASDKIGIYNVALRVTLALTLFQTGFGTVFAPIIAELHHASNFSELSRLLKVITRWSTAITLPVFLVMFCFAGDLMSIFGEEFAAGKLVLQVLAVGIFFNVAVGPIGWFIVLTGRSYLSLVNSLVALLVNLVVTIFLTTKFGIIGAATAILLGLLVVNLMRLAQIRSIFGIHPFSVSLWKSMLTGCVALLIGIGLSHMKWPLVFSITVWGILAKLTLCAVLLTIVCIAVLYLLRFDDYDKYVFRSIQTRFLKAFRMTSS